MSRTKIGHDIIVVGASAGGVEALEQLAQSLPASLPAAVFVVLHVPPQGPSVLPRILGRAGPLPAAHAVDGQPIEPGQIVIAPPDHHLVIKSGRVRLTPGPREKSHRPAVDALFRTAARAYGGRVVGAVFSGVLDDGTAGLLAIKAHGGLAVVQDPEDALYDGMPRSALENVVVDHVATAARMGELLARLATEPAPLVPPGDRDEKQEADMAEMNPGAMHDQDRAGRPSAFGCPECGGTLWELEDGDVIRFRCRVGHAYSAPTLLAEQADAPEAALWTALRALEEQVGHSGRMAERARGRGHDRAAEVFEQQLADLTRHAEVIRRILLARQGIEGILAPDRETEGGDTHRRTA